MNSAKQVFGKWRIALTALVAALLPSVGHAAEGGHQSIVALLIPMPWRAELRSLANWGQVDVVANSIFFGLVMLVVMGLLALRLRRLPETRAQNLIEMLIEGLNNTFTPVLGEGGKKYLPFVNTYFVVVLFWNLAGLLPAVQAPTAELNTTLALAIVSIVAVQLIALKEIGVWGYIKHLAVIEGPIFMLPLQLFMFALEAITQVSRVVSLSLRLFANMYAKELVLLALWELSIQLFYIPVQLPVLFIGLLASIIQAFIFAVLTSVYIGLFVAHAGHSDHDHGHDHSHGHDHDHDHSHGHAATAHS
ncbi:MAG: F0F1 ATP synthase subunit A [Candidatus Poribacteria bacterium]|nr:F0F1 ATP synthase subunit A [Candidatus Poribacteria bacterium]